MEARNDIRAIVELDGEQLFDDTTLEDFLDRVSEAITGSDCGLLGITHRIVHLPDPTKGTVAWEITADEIEWDTLSGDVDGDGEEGTASTKMKNPPSRRLTAIEFVPNSSFHSVLNIDIVNFFEWMEKRECDEEDLYDDVIWYEHDGHSGRNSITREDLVKAKIDVDGKLTLEDGEQLYLKVQKTLDLLANTGLAYFEAMFRRSPTPEQAQQLRDAAVMFRRENSIDQAKYEECVAKAEEVLAAFRQTPEGQPDPKLPFYGCKLPTQIMAVELVSSDARASEWSERCTAAYTSDSIVEWLEGGRQWNDFDEGDEVLTFDDRGSLWSLCVRDLLNAKLDADGRFELKDGTEFFLIQEDGKRWFPKDRV
jgi:hypothetical protein